MAVAFETGAPRNHTAFGLDTSCDDDIIHLLLEIEGGGAASAVSFMGLGVDFAFDF